MSASCAFCRIVAGEADAHRVLEDDDFVAFLDARPLFPGHVLLVPREHVVTIMDAPRELLGPLARIAGAEVEHRVDPALVRAHEVMEVRGSAERLRAATGWEPEIPLETTLADTIAWWRGEIRAGRAYGRVHD
jgi:nucleoside-diphosphate-sugar epimerase